MLSHELVSCPRHSQARSRILRLMCFLVCVIRLPSPPHSTHPQVTCRQCVLPRDVNKALSVNTYWD